MKPLIKNYSPRDAAYDALMLFGGFAIGFVLIGFT